MNDNHTVENSDGDFYADSAKETLLKDSAEALGDCAGQGSESVELRVDEH